VRRRSEGGRRVESGRRGLRENVTRPEGKEVGETGAEELVVDGGALDPDGGDTEGVSREIVCGLGTLTSSRPATPSAPFGPLNIPSTFQLIQTISGYIFPPKPQQGLINTLENSYSYERSR
jgi:hypothetical protein